MNIQFQVCGLCILFLLLLFHASHKNLRLYKERVYFTVLCIMIISLIADILSLIAIHYQTALPGPFVKFVCKSYIVTLIWGSWSALFYMIADLVSQQRHKSITARLVILANVQALIIYALPIYIYDDGKQTYTYGPSTLAVYAFVLLYIAATLIMTHIYRKWTHPRRRFAIDLWMLIWTVCAAIQFFRQELLLVGFASALGVLILFTMIENPEANMERRLGCFNSYALTEYLNELYESGEDFSLMEISFENEKFLEEHGVDINAVIKIILQLCKKDVLVFKNINLSLVLISNSSEKLHAVGTTILEKFSISDFFRNATLLTLAHNAGSFSDAGELVQFLAFVETQYREEKGVLISVDEQMIHRFKNQFTIEREIALALGQDRVEVFLQPIYSTQTQQFTSAEALVRIRKRNGELLPPGLFIPVAENNGQILELGERVFEKVCAFLKNSDAIGLGIDYIEVNLSVVQCEHTELADRLLSIIEKYQLDPRRINLEITETASIRARKNLLENMKKLIAHGFSFSLDDFGKGESNLMYVVEMPVSIIKLDYDMTKAFFHTPKAQQVVRAVVGMAHDMGLKIVAEGIETKEEMEQITREGADYIQGYYFSKPLPMQEFLDFLKRTADS